MSGAQGLSVVQRLTGRIGGQVSRGVTGLEVLSSAGRRFALASRLNGREHKRGLAGALS